MPIAHALAINVSQRQRQLLQQIIRCKTNSYRLVQRAQLVLFAAEGMKNTMIGEQLQLSRTQVRKWRQRWLEAFEQLQTDEAEGISDPGLTQKRRPQR
jgi:transposase